MAKSRESITRDMDDLVRTIAESMERREREIVVSGSPGLPVMTNAEVSSEWRDILEPPYIQHVGPGTPLYDARTGEVVSTNIPHVCTECGEKFDSSFILKVHVATAHPSEPPDELSAGYSKRKVIMPKG